MKRKDMLKLPERERREESTYSSIFIIPTGRKHDSGWALMAIIGCNDKGEPVEIAAYCDDVCYDFGLVTHKEYAMRTDMTYPENCLHVWSWYYDFKVGFSLSSTYVRLIPKKGGKKE